MSKNEWQLDVEPDQLAPPPPPLTMAPPVPILPPAMTEVDVPNGVETEGESTSRNDDPPPSPLQIIEAMLFVGGSPLTAAVACSAVRGLTSNRFDELVEELAKKYRVQNRPYVVQSRGDGFVLTIKPTYRTVKERLTGGPREARLSGAAVEVLSLIAYRQPLAKGDVDALRGADCGGVIRQLVRLGLIAVTTRGTADDPGVRYATTDRFLSLFGLGSLDDLPQLGDSPV